MFSLFSSLLHNSVFFLLHFLIFAYVSLFIFYLNSVSLFFSPFSHLCILFPIYILSYSAFSPSFSSIFLTSFLSGNFPFLSHIYSMVPFSILLPIFPLCVTFSYSFHIFFSFLMLYSFLFPVFTLKIYFIYIFFTFFFLSTYPLPFFYSFYLFFVSPFFRIYVSCLLPFLWLLSLTSVSSILLMSIYLPVIFSLLLFPRFPSSLYLLLFLFFVFFISLFFSSWVFLWVSSF